MNIAFVRLYRGIDDTGEFYNLQEVGLAKALCEKQDAKEGTQVHILILTSQKEGYTREIVKDKIWLHSVPTKGIGHHGILDTGWLEKLHIDAVHLQSDNMLFAPEVIKYCLKHHIPCHNYIGTIYSDNSSAWKRKMLSVIFARNLHWYRKIPTFAKTPTVQKQLVDAGVPHTILAPVALDLTVIPEIQESKADLRAELGLADDKTWLVFVGRLEEYKHPMDALNLIQRLPENYNLLMIGKGSLDHQIKREIREKELENKVRQIMQVKNTEIHRWIKSCDFFVNFNPNEIYGMAILEAMYQGSAVCAIHAPGPDFLLEDNQTGILCDDISEMEKRILLSDADMRRELGEKAQNEVECKYQWNATADIILKEVSWGREK